MDNIPSALLAYSFLFGCFSITNELLHPDHVKPLVELPAAFMEMANLCETKVLMEQRTRLGNVLAFILGDGDAGIHILEALLDECLFQCLIE